MRLVGQLGSTAPQRLPAQHEGQLAVDTRPALADGLGRCALVVAGGIFTAGLACAPRTGGGATATPEESAPDKPGEPLASWSDMARNVPRAPSPAVGSLLAKLDAALPPGGVECRWAASSLQTALP